MQIDVCIMQCCRGQSRIFLVSKQLLLQAMQAQSSRNVRANKIYINILACTFPKLYVNKQSCLALKTKNSLIAQFTYYNGHTFTCLINGQGPKKRAGPKKRTGPKKLAGLYFSKICNKWVGLHKNYLYRYGSSAIFLKI